MTVCAVRMSEACTPYPEAAPAVKERSEAAAVMDQVVMGSRNDSLCRMPSSLSFVNNNVNKACFGNISTTDAAKILCNSSDPVAVNRQWEFKTGCVIDSSPCIGPDGTVYAGSRDAKLYALKSPSAEVCTNDEKSEDLSDTQVNDTIENIDDEWLIVGGVKVPIKNN